LTLSLATVERALKALAQKDQEKEEELAEKASSKAARQAAKENKLALQAAKENKLALQAAKENKLTLQAAAAEKREVDRNGREKEKEERAQKLAQRKREREEARPVPPPQRKGNKPLSHYQIGPLRSRQSDNQVVVHQVWEVERLAQKQHRYLHPKSPEAGATLAFQVNIDTTTLSH
jgi:hypothetical protein